MNDGDFPLIPVRRLHNYIYCPRLMYFQFVENIFIENSDTVEGDMVHSRVDVPSSVEYPDEILNGAKKLIRSMAMEDSELGICGVADLIKQLPDETWCLYDYKRGAPRRDESGSPAVKDGDALQIQAYSYLARKYGMSVSMGRIYYAETKTLLDVPIDDNFAYLKRIVSEVKTAIRNPLPQPLENDIRCMYCSAYPICLPEESIYWKRQHKITHPVYPPYADDNPGELLIVQNPRAYVSKRGDSVVVSLGSEAISSHPLHMLRNIYIYGAAQLTTQMIHCCLTEGINVSFFSPAGKFLGRLDTMNLSGLDARHGQYRIAENEKVSLKLMKAMIQAKISNQRTLLMRNGKERNDNTLKMMSALKREVQKCGDKNELQGVEGSAAALYFDSFATMLRNPDFANIFHGRNRRPPRDPVNAMLSLGYSILSSEIAGICNSVGLDPACGLLHVPRFGRPALALDLMEEFRPLIVDSVVITLVNRGDVDINDFYFSSEGCSLKRSAHQAFWSAYAHRMEEELIHPAFHYRVSYRRLLEIQVRQVWRIFRGDATNYYPIITR